MTQERATLAEHDAFRSKHVLHSPSYSAAERIIKICRTEADKRLRDYDRAVARAKEARR